MRKISKERRTPKKRFRGPAKLLIFYKSFLLLANGGDISFLFCLQLGSRKRIVLNMPNLQIFKELFFFVFFYRLIFLKISHNFYSKMSLLGVGGAML